jgi:hypothetical protein
MVGLRRNRHAAGSGRRFKADGDVHTISEYFVFVGEHISHVDAEAEVHGSVCREMIIAFRHHLLYRDRGLDCSDDARKLQQETIAGVLHNPAAVIENDRVNRGSMGLECGVRTRLIGAHHSRITGDVGADYCG